MTFAQKPFSLFRPAFGNPGAIAPWKFALIFLLVAGISLSNPTHAKEATEPAQTDVFVGGKDGYKAYRIPAVVVTDRGTVLAFCEGRKDGPEDVGDIDLLLKRSSDQGSTWCQHQIIHEEGGDAPITIGNPCPIFDPRDKTTHLLFTRNNKQLFYTRSRDDGQTWSVPVEQTDSLKSLDYPRVRLGTGPGHGIVLRNGRLIVPVWFCDRELSERKKDPTLSRFQAGVLYSDDRGASWKPGQLVPPDLNQLNECVALERSDGSLLLNLRGTQLGFRSLSTSQDGGATWSSPVLQSNLPCPTCQASLINLSKEEILFSNPAVSSTRRPNGDTRRNLTVRLSPDGGRTWSHSRTLEPGFSGYSDLAILKDGSVLCLYETGQKVYNEKIRVARFNRAWIVAKESPSLPTP